MACRFQLVNVTLNVRVTQKRDKFGFFWKVSTRSYYGHFINGFYSMAFLSYEKVKTCRYINFTKNVEDFTANNLFEVCANEETKGCYIIKGYNSGLSYRLAHSLKENFYLHP